jgi:uncharacterized membrane protein YdjX (TVP38/TMEM64 family)
MNALQIFKWLEPYLVAHPIIAPVLYALLHIIFAVCMIPCSPMAIIAGALWGKWLGLAISIVSAFLSSCTTFWLARIFFRQRIHAFLVKKFKKTDWFLEQVRKKGWKFVATVQLNPVAPGSTLGYLFGLTNISFLVYAFFLLLFMLPLQIILVLCGGMISQLLSGKVTWILLIVMLLSIIYLFLGVKSEGKS